jgi:hypothetical protein
MKFSAPTRSAADQSLTCPPEQRCMGGSGACWRCTNARRECTYGELDSMEDRVFRGDISGCFAAHLPHSCGRQDRLFFFVHDAVIVASRRPTPARTMPRLTTRSVNPLTASRSTPCNIRGRHSEHCVLRPSLTVWTTSSPTTSPQRDQVCLLRCVGTSSRSPR